MSASGLDVAYDLFSGKVDGAVLMLTFREKPLLHVADINAKRFLFAYLDRVAACDEIKVLLIKEAPTKMKRAEYVAFYRNMIKPDLDQVPLERMYNALNQFILKLAGFSKIIVHADSGDVILLFMNIGLACDFRVVAEGTVFQNPNIELGVVPKGGSVFFLSRMVGTATASRLLFSGRDIDARDACRMGLVDKVVPREALDRIALETARQYARIPSGYAVGIKKLLNYDIHQLAGYLEYENALLRRLVRSASLQNFGRLQDE